MEMPRVNWDVVKPAGWSAIVGFFAGMLVLSYGFGFMSRSAADLRGAANAEKAVVAALAPVCAEKFRALPDVAERTAVMVANKDNAWAMRRAFPDALITTPGQSYGNSDLAAACGKLILAPSK